MTDATEALARALAEVYGINPGDEDHSPGAEHLTKRLAALGYEVRPIEKLCAIRNRRYGPCTLAKGHDGLHRWSIEQAAEAADREAAGGPGSRDAAQAVKDSTLASAAAEASR